MAHREFTDDTGREWEAWEVRSTTASDRREAIHRVALAPQLQSGWLAFRSGLERRRIVPIPSDWATMSEVELRKLLDQAQPVGLGADGGASPELS
jgi:hypothetical protein